MDPVPFQINTLTSCCLQRSRIPITLPTDCDVIQTALETCWRIDPAEARVVVIPNTLEVKTLWVSSPLEAEVRAHPHLSARPSISRCPSATTDRWTWLGSSPRAPARGGVPPEHRADSPWIVLGHSRDHSIKS